MSSTTPNKATQTSPEQTSTKKTGKRSSKNVAKTSAPKSQGSSTGARKKTATKKAAGKKTTTKKRVTAKTSKVSGISKKTVATQEQNISAPTQATPAPANSATEDSKSLSWMSAQAASALKAVKASQAEKGQAVLARTRKQATESHLDDDSLMKIAAAMPVDNEALVEFSAEQPIEELTGQAEAIVPAAQPVPDNAGGIAGPIVDSSELPATPVAETEEVAGRSTSPAGQAETSTLPSPPPTQHPGRRPAGYLPAMAAVLLFATLLAGYYFWPEDNDSSALVATQEGNDSETPAATTEANPVTGQQGMAPEDVATAPVAEPEQPIAENINERQSTTLPPPSLVSPEPAQAAAVTPVAEPGPAPAYSPAPVTRAPIVEQQAPAYSPPPVTRAPTVEPQAPATQPELPPVSISAPAPAAAPTPAQTDNRAPAPGYYPQQRRPAYPQYYYR